MFGGRNVVLLLALQIAEATEYVDSPAISRPYPDNLNASNSAWLASWR
jgi:hypothetical protein